MGERYSCSTHRFISLISRGCGEENGGGDIVIHEISVQNVFIFKWKDKRIMAN